MSTEHLYEKLAAYQAAMEHEQGVRTSYQGLLVTVQGILFGLTFTLAQLRLQSQNWVLSFLAILVCVLLGSVCEYRARNVDLWRRNIIRLVEGTELERTFLDCNYRWYPLSQKWLQYIVQYLLGHWFERIVVLCMLAAWSYLLFQSAPHLVVSVIAMLSSLFWFTYTFRLLRFRGGKMPDELTY